MAFIRYKITSPTIAVVDRNTQHVPAGSVIEVDTETLLGGNQLINVTWDGKQMMMFAQDVRSRGEQLDGFSSSGLEV